MLVFPDDIDVHNPAEYVTRVSRQAMRDRGLSPDTVLCNSYLQVLDGLPLHALRATLVVLA